MIAVEKFLIYTDGGCSKNGSENCDGALAFIIIDAGGVIVGRGCEHVKKTTNNRMELGAAIAGIRALKDLKTNLENIDCVIVTDSQYMSKGYSEYMREWMRRGWRKSDGKPVVNLDLWLAIKEFSPEFLSLTFKWVRGHADDRYNCECDAMVNRKLRGGRAQALATTVQVLDAGDPVMADAATE